jgi:hypothetical protein
MSTIDSKPTKPVARSPLDPNRHRLDTWKEIAVYLGREVRTAQRWEKREGLTVHRHIHTKGCTVYAFKHEVDAWLRRRRRAEREPALKKGYSEHGTDWLNPTLLAATRITPRSRLWLQNAAAGVGSVDLLQGENRIRLYFYIQLQGEPDVNSSAKNSVNRGTCVNELA